MFTLHRFVFRIKVFVHFSWLVLHNRFYCTGVIYMNYSDNIPLHVLRERQCVSLENWNPCGSCSISMHACGFDCCRHDPLSKLDSDFRVSAAILCSSVCYSLQPCLQILPSNLSCCFHFSVWKVTLLFC